MIIDKNGKSIFHPGELLKDFLLARNIIQNEFAQRCGITEKHLSNIINAKANITSDFAIKLSLVLNENPQTWLNMQNMYNITKSELVQKSEFENYITKLDLFPIKEMQQLNLIKKCKTKIELVKELFSFFAIADTKDFLKIAARKTPVSYRKFNATEVNIDKNKAADLVLFRWGEILADSIQDIPHYNKVKFLKALTDIRSKQCLNHDTLLEYAKNKCFSEGVYFITSPKIKNAMASGYSCKHKNNPLIHITDGGKQIDQFWFSFYHKSSYILDCSFNKTRNLK